MSGAYLIVPRGGWLFRWALPLAALLTAAVLGVGCAGEPELGGGPDVYTTNPSDVRIRIMEVDQELSRQAQSGSLDLNNLPAGRRSYMEVTIDEAGNQVSVPWVVKTGFFFTQIDIFYAETEAAGDGTYTVVLALNDEQGRDNSVKLQQMTAPMAASAASGSVANLAVIRNEQVVALVPVTVPLVNGQIMITGQTQAEADRLTSGLADRAFRFPEEGAETRVAP